MTLLIEDFLAIVKNPPAYFITSLAIMALIALFAFIVGHKVEKMDVRAKPNKLMTVVIEGIGGFNNFIKGVDTSMVNIQLAKISYNMGACCCAMGKYDNPKTLAMFSQAMEFFGVNANFRIAKANCLF